MKKLLLLSLFSNLFILNNIEVASLIDKCCGMDRNCSKKNKSDAEYFKVSNPFSDYSIVIEKDKTSRNCSSYSYPPLFINASTHKHHSNPCITLFLPDQDETYTIWIYDKIKNQKLNISTIKNGIFHSNSQQFDIKNKILSIRLNKEGIPEFIIEV